MKWYENKTYLLYAGIVVVVLIIVLVLIFSRRSAYEPLAALTRTVQYIKSSTNKDVFDTERINVSDNVLPILNVRSAQISAYYGGDQYQKDMVKLVQLCHDTAGVKRLPSDCYELSTTNIVEMTLDDQQRIVSNLLLKIIPSLTVLCDQHQYGDMASVLLMYFHIIYGILGLNSSHFIVPSYQSDKLVSVRYSNQLKDGSPTFLPVSYYIGLLKNGYGTNRVKIQKMTDEQIVVWIEEQSVPDNQKEFMRSLIRNVTNPLNDMSLPQSDTVDIPVELFGKLAMMLVCTVLTGMRYQGERCE
jgi:hypothetical protein